jgi:hypothetical protein
VRRFQRPGGVGPRLGSRAGSRVRGERPRRLVRQAPLSWADILADYDRRIRAMHDELGLTPAQFAERVGAARKASSINGKHERCPSPVFWHRIQVLGRDV